MANRQFSVTVHYGRMKTRVLYEPVSHAEAAAMILEKPAVLRPIFDRLLPELRARAFTITKVEDIKVLQQARDAIADLPKGAAWDDVKDKVIEQLSPWLDEGAARARAEMLMRHHGFLAYEAAQYEIAQAVADDFPYWQYMTMGDEAVRDSHAALHGLILPRDHPFWDDHYPPWDWGCRCMVVPITAEDAGKVGVGQTNPSGWRLLPAQDRMLRESGRLDLGTGIQEDVRSPKLKAAERGEDPDAAWQWKPGDLRIPISALAERYEPEVFKAFSDFAQRTHVDFADGRRTLWDWLYDPIRQQAAGECVNYGVASGKEMVIALDYDTGRRIGAVKGEEGKVNPESLIEDAKAKGLRLSLIHNHLKSGYPSPADTLRLAQGGVMDITSAIALGGYRIEPGPGMASISQNTISELRVFAKQQKAKTLNLTTWLKFLGRLDDHGVISWRPR